MCEVSADKPTLIIDEARCRSNIEHMAGKARASGVVFRPHFKTHQSLHVGKWFRDYGVQAITVSSAQMAAEFAADGWTDITIAFPANLRESGTYNRLARKIQLNLLADSAEVITHLGRSLSHTIGLFVEIDIDYKRSGINHKDYNAIEACLNAFDKFDNLLFKGFLTHSGNTYQAGSKEEIWQIYHHAMGEMNTLKSRFSSKYPGLIISVGDTPSSSIVEKLDEADEIRPGNFVYYDLMQQYLGTCDVTNIAVSVACPVCGIYPDRNEILIYGGAIHLSKEFIETPDKLYGLVVQYNNNGWTMPVHDTQLISLSQEHGIIRTNSQLINSIKHGDLLGILPVHSCLTANLLKDSYRVI